MLGLCLQGALRVLRVLQDPNTIIKYQASHMCHDKACIWWMHLFWELAHINLERNLCTRFNRLLPAGDAWRNIVAPTCPHGPRCHPRRSQFLVSCSGSCTYGGRKARWPSSPMAPTAAPAYMH